MSLTPRARPAPEAVTYDGTNADAVFDLCRRVAALHVWGPLEPGVSPLAYTVRTDPAEPHLGVCVTKGRLVPHPSGTGEQILEDVIVVRVEEGNTLIFDPFETTPLFVLTPELLAAFYEGGA